MRDYWSSPNVLLLGLDDGFMCVHTESSFSCALIIGALFCIYAETGRGRAQPLKE